MIFESADGRYPSIEELVLCDLFRNIDLREMRGPGIAVSLVFSICLVYYGISKSISFSVFSLSNQVLVHPL